MLGLEKDSITKFNCILIQELSNICSWHNFYISNPWIYCVNGINAANCQISLNFAINVVEYPIHLEFISVVPLCFLILDDFWVFRKKSFCPQSLINYSSFSEILEELNSVEKDDSNKKTKGNLFRLYTCRFLCPHIEDRGGYCFCPVCHSVILSLCPPLWNFNLANNFWTVSARALLLQLNIPCDKTFPWILLFLTLWPWPRFDPFIENFNLANNLLNSEC